MSLGIAPFVAAMLLAAASMVSAQDSHFRPDHQQIPTPGCLVMTGAWEGGSKPCTKDEHDAWLADIRHWRDERRIRIGHDGSRYDLPALKWTQSSFFQPQMMVEDRYFYDPVAHSYTGIVTSMTWRRDTAGSIPCSSGPRIRIWASITGTSTT
jgi:hypothetical protein